MEKVTLINKNGNEQEYEIVLAYEDPNTKKGYIVYREDEESNQLYVSSYDPNNDDNLELHDVTKEEKDMIMNILKGIK